MTSQVRTQSKATCSRPGGRDNRGCNRRTRTGQGERGRTRVGKRRNAKKTNEATEKQNKTTQKESEPRAAEIGRVERYERRRNRAKTAGDRIKGVNATGKEKNRNHQRKQTKLKGPGPGDKSTALQETKRSSMRSGKTVKGKRFKRT